MLNLAASTKARLTALSVLTISSGLYTAFLDITLAGDFRNYHYYIGYSLLNDRLSLDIAPATFRTYFSPTLNALRYYLTQELPYFWFKFLYGAFSGLAFYWTWEIACLIFAKERDTQYRRLMVWSAMAYGIFGHQVLVQMGRWHGEPVTAVFALAGLYCLLTATTFSNLKILRLIFAGLLIGASMGLKLTSTYLALGLLAVCGYMGLQHRSWQPFVLGGLFLALGFLVTEGYWLWIMYSKFENPIFPMMNSVFQSPWADIGEDFRGRTKLIPTTVLDFILSPFSTIAEDQHMDGKRVYSDLHLPFLFGTAIVALILNARKLTTWHLVRQQGNAEMHLYVFYFLSFYAWTYEFSIIRYLYPVQLLSGVVLFSLFCKISERKIVVCTVGLLMTIISAVITYQYSHFSKMEGSPFLTPANALSSELVKFRGDVGALPNEGIVIIPGVQSVTHFIPSLSPSLRFVGIDNELVKQKGGNRLSKEVSEIMDEYRDSLFVLYPITSENRTKRANRALQEFGLTVQWNSCTKLYMEMGGKDQETRALLCELV